jgi:cellobiose-specific phosphotransferase system component IIC
MSLFPKRNPLMNISTVIAIIPSRYIDITATVTFLLMSKILGAKNKTLEKIEFIDTIQIDSISTITKQTKSQKLKNIVKKTWNSRPIKAFRNRMYTVTPLLVAGLIIFLIIKPGRVSAEEYFPAQEYFPNISQPTTPTFYQKMLNKLKPVANYGTLIVNGSSMFNILEYSARSLVLFKQGDYENLAYSIGQLSLNSCTLVLGQFSRQAKTAEEKLVYDGLQKVSLGLATTFRLSSDTW